MYIKNISGIPFVVGSVTFALNQVRWVGLTDPETIYVSLGTEVFLRILESKDTAFFQWVKETLLTPTAT